MTPGDPTHGEDDTPPGPVTLDRLGRVRRARGVEPAHAGEERRDTPLVPGDQGEERSRHHTAPPPEALATRSVIQQPGSLERGADPVTQVGVRGARRCRARH